ncbi:YceI family protein [Ideonella sp. A 288]|uniref:YceI family protein n=1 Tax=Ideonella sp. A 288 TaxID=1962181 RepID=UPI000B4B696E|nr:YceI family protein [Ideonella sp. A 288]
MTLNTPTLPAALALCFGLAASAAQAADPVAKLVPAQSEVVFTIKQMGVPVEGKFKKFDAQVSFDAKKPEAGKVGFTIDIGSATMGSAEADAELPKPVWFGTAKFPQATFQSAAIKAVGGARYEVTGKLGIKGNLKDVVVPVTIAAPTAAGGPSIASGAFTIKRLEFKVGENEWADTSMVANDVQVRFKLALTGLGAP